MKRLLLIFLLLAFTFGTGHVGAATAKGTAADSRKQSQKGKKKKLTRQQVHKLQKKAETEAKQHNNEIRRREYLQMQEAQRRGMMQTQQHVQEK